MLTLRRAGERGYSDLGWLSSHHTFSFLTYSDPKHNGFCTLRVINDDRVAPGKGFGPHGHRNMEILSYVLEGKLAHKDSMGRQHVVGPNEVQVMSAGTGVIHSEYNGSAAEPLRFLQIWIIPSKTDLEPSYQHFAYSPAEKRGGLRLIAGPERQTHPPSAFIHQDARVYAAVLETGESVAYPIAAGRHAWVQCAAGRIDVNGLALGDGDGVAVSAEPSLSFRGAGEHGGQFLLFDLGRLDGERQPADVNVLVVFYSRYGKAEKLALEAGVGAIQANANIRLRRLEGPADRTTIEADSAWKENLDRMTKDYIVPRPDDPVWADVVILATPADSAAAVETYLATLRAIGSMDGKIAASLAPGDSESALRPVHAAAARAGLIVVPARVDSGDAVASARAYGQRVTRMARALKEPARGSRTSRDQV